MGGRLADIRSKANMTAAFDTFLEFALSETGSTVLSNSSPSPQTAGTPLLVGFSGGQIQLIDPVRKELSKLFNEEVHNQRSLLTQSQ